MKRKYEVDEDAIECPLCSELLSPPIHQCQNGHMACDDCCKKLQGKECPSCRAMPFAHSRNLGLESIVESLRTTCVYASEGCTEMVKIADKDKHAREACEFRNLICPMPRCGHTGPKLKIPDHFASVHVGRTVLLPPGARNGRYNIMAEPMLGPMQCILFKAEKELFLVYFERDSKVVVSRENWFYPHSIIMFCCSSFGNDLRYNMEVTVKGRKEGEVSLTTTLSNALAVDNQVTENVFNDKNLILVPQLHRSVELMLELL